MGGEPAGQMAALYGCEARLLDGRPIRLDEWRGRVLLIVNVASRCGFTPQYRELEALYRRHAPRGFAVLGFPCNQFGGQEPGTPAEIAAFCSTTYDVTFPIFEPIDVNGPGAHPVFRVLTAARPGLFGARAIRWNFTKFLVSRDGRVVKRYAPSTPPRRIEPAIEGLLATRAD